MKKWNDKMKKAVLIAALLTVGIGAFIGIRYFIYEENSKSPTLETETTIADESEVLPKTQIIKPESPAVVINTESTDSFKETEEADAVQSIQKEPIKTKEEKPNEPPAEVIESEVTKEQPENKEIPAKITQPTITDTSGTPKDGDIKNGKIYFEGFGWVDYNGGGTSGTQADDIYENGNKIGIMD